MAVFHSGILCLLWNPVKHLSFFVKKALSYMLDRVLNTPLQTRNTANL